MRVLTINELWRLTRIELASLAQQVKAELAKFRDGSPERANALTSLRNIHIVAARKRYYGLE